MIFKTKKAEFIRPAIKTVKTHNKIEWDTPKQEIEYNTIVIDSIETLRESLDKIKEQKIFSFDYETAPKKEIREYYTKKINSIDETISRELALGKKELIDRYKKTSLSPFIIVTGKQIGRAHV